MSDREIEVDIVGVESAEKADRHIDTARQSDERTLSRFLFLSYLNPVINSTGIKAQVSPRTLSSTRRPCFIVLPARPSQSRMRANHHGPTAIWLMCFAQQITASLISHVQRSFSTPYGYLHLDATYEYHRSPGFHFYPCPSANRLAQLAGSRLLRAANPPDISIRHIPFILYHTRKLHRSVQYLGLPVRRPGGWLELLMRIRDQQTRKSSSGWGQ